MNAADKPEDEKSSDNAETSPASSGLPSPKRGAFPTPKAELEKAMPYVPEAESSAVSLPVEPHSSTDDAKGGAKTNSTQRTTPANGQSQPG